MIRLSEPRLRQPAFSFLVHMITASAMFSALLYLIVPQLMGILGRGLSPIQHASSNSHGANYKDNNDYAAPSLLASAELDEGTLPQVPNQANEHDIVKGVVIPRLKHDDVTWMRQHLTGLEYTVYVADGAPWELRPPSNKGHEALIYLTYIIDHYANLPDVVIFMHAHRHTHHNNALLDFDAASMIEQLRTEHVLRQGYFNMRCKWDPGCPSWLHSESHGETLMQQEQSVLSESWLELYPQDTAHVDLAQPCCAQFAVSNRQILLVPLSHFVFFRDWIMRTPLSDYFSGRIFEYTWQYLFLGKEKDCPVEAECYCQGFGLCAV